MKIGLHILCLTLVLTFSSISYAQEVEITLYRWDLGYLASPEPSTKRIISDQDLNTFFSSKDLQTIDKSEGLYQGCYLVKVDTSSGRSPSSEKDFSYRKKCFIEKSES
ncbi:MAG: hypothetical protein M9962_02790 [Oligoflexia bacterium]|nr:hypothetical protein [Oligoflexia bacterium]